MAGQPKRHFIVPDTQIRPGVPTDHIDWIAKAICEYRPDTVICLGDWWDFPSLNGHEEPGSIAIEGQRYSADVKAGNEAFARLSEPIRALRKSWRPRTVFLDGNHENRADRAAEAQPKFFGHIGSTDCDTQGWERKDFLERLWIDGIVYAHYFQSSHSSRPVGGEVSNRLSRIGASFVQGHEQGFRYGNRIMGCGRTIHGLVAGSCYLHEEAYRGAQSQRHWRGVVILNEVEDGDYCVMPLTLSYLCRKYERARLSSFMAKKHPWGDWKHLGSEGLNDTRISGDSVQQASGGAGVRAPPSVPRSRKAHPARAKRVQPNRTQSSNRRTRRA